PSPAFRAHRRYLLRARCWAEFPDGYELMRQLRALPGMEKVPAFALTGYGQPEDVAKAHEVGFDAHFTKPVDLDELDRRLREAIKQER
ncbi:MAG TPA: response regulator, partial [Armatimonadota bacterium]|nr:response regulator [Armatimonadota bacterium]